MGDNTILFDVEGVLADIHTVVLQESDLLTASDYQSWNFGSERKYREFMDVADSVWDNYTKSILLTEQDVPYITHHIGESNTVKIVTHRTGHDDAITTWLDSNNIYYDEFYSVDGVKTDLVDGDRIVDDNPTVVRNAVENDVSPYLYSRLWNYGPDNEFPSDVTRIHALKQLY